MYNQHPDLNRLRVTQVTVPHYSSAAACCVDWADSFPKTKNKKIAKCLKLLDY